MLVAKVVLDGIGSGVRAADKLAIASDTLLSAAMLAAALELAAAACEASMTMVEVTVGREGSVEPEASTVTSLMLLTVLCGGATSDSISVDVAMPGMGVVVVLLVLLLVVVVVELVKVLNMLRTSDATAAAWDEASAVNVLLAVVTEAVGRMGSESGSTPPLKTVTVCVIAACGSMKFGAMLIPGCLLVSQLHAAAVGDTSREGKLL